MSYCAFPKIVFYLTMVYKLEAVRAFFLPDFWYYYRYMTIVTIPKEFSKTAQLVAVPSFVYKEYTAIQKKIKGAKTVRSTASERHLIARGRREFKQGKFVSLSEI